VSALNEPGYVDAPALDGTAADARVWLSATPAGAIYRSFGIDPAAVVDEAAVRAEITARQNHGLPVDGAKLPMSGSVVDQIRAKHTERGGVWVNIPDTRPAWQQAMDVPRVAAQTRMGLDTPSGKDDVAREMEQLARDRYESARMRRDAALGPLARTVDFGD
jgi:hypothetical protein